MITTKNVHEALQASWWETVKNEVVRTVTLRSKAKHEVDKPHGSILGEMFVMAMNEDPSVRLFVNYLLTRGWSEVVDDLKAGLSPQVKRTLLDVEGEGEAWFSEFRAYLSRAWAKSVGPSDPKDIFNICDRAMFHKLRKEWIKHVESGTSAAPLAQVLVEWMRDADDHAARQMAVKAYVFISVRGWPEVLATLRTSDLINDPIQDLVGLDCPKAEEYYDEWKLMVMATVGDYWDSLVGPDTKGESNEGDGENSQNN